MLIEQNDASIDSTPSLTVSESLSSIPSGFTDARSISVPSAPPCAQPAGSQVAGEFQNTSKPHPLARFSLSGQGNALGEEAVQAKPLLANLSLSGELSAWYGPPNTGKTLLVLHFATEAVQERRIEPGAVFYVNVDDSMSGVAAKVQILDDFGMHSLATGHKGFKSAHLIPAMREMVKDGSAQGTLVILDTLKKFADLMSKAECREFGNVAREFSMAGGSLVALAHTNKNRSANQKLVYAGTSDIIEDFDNAYLLDGMKAKGGGQERVIRFECLKNRGDTVQEAFYAYSAEEGLTYARRLASVRQVDPEFGVKEDDVRNVDPNVIIQHIRAAIAAGSNKKMEIASVVGKATKASRTDVLKFLDQFTSDDPSCGLWSFERRRHGAHVFFLHPSPATSGAG